MLMCLPWPKQKQAVEETKAVFGPLRERIAAAVEKLEGLLVGSLSLALFHLLLQCYFMGLFWEGGWKRERNVCCKCLWIEADYRLFDL